MEVLEERPQRFHFAATSRPDQTPARIIVPILQPQTTQSFPQSPGDPMEVAPPATAMMAPPARTSPDGEANGVHDHMVMGDQPSSGSLAGPSAAAAASGAHGPKVVQTAFIHKLYNMLEDQSIQHLISWSGSAESFIMSPSNDFSKVLSQYFKHTNISSFVRQLNMYGFHKVSDVFHTGSPDSPLWEFKHGNGNFKRGDLVGLREIKRRASRHALVHRESYSTPKPPPSQPGTPAEPMHAMQDSVESRLTTMEHSLYEIHGRLQRSEENSQFMHVRNQVVMEALSRSLHFNSDLSRALLSLIPSQDSPIHRDIVNMQAEIQRQTDLIRSFDEQPEPPFSGSRSYFSNLSLDNGPVSPRQTPQDDPRRASMMGVPSRQNFYRPPVPSHLSLTPRRLGSIGGSGTAQSSPSSLRSQAPPPPPPHPLATVVSPPSLQTARRHTSADIHNHIPTNWPPTASPFGNGQSPSQWASSSPKRGPTALVDEGQHIRDSFSSYSLTAASSQGRTDGSRPATPPPFSNGNGNSTNHLDNWSWGTAREKIQGGLFSNNSGPPTRRGSMAHILNPAETAERAEEHEEELREEDRKRKRIQ